MNIPSELKYTKEHEWIKIEGNMATIGITDYAQGELGDIVFVELPEIDSEIIKQNSFGTIEAVKAVSDMFAPLSGKVVEVNADLDDDPTAVNNDPYGKGWFIKIEISNNSELDELLDSEQYKELIG